ncbi:MAG: FKBP-type peptidyl-prolyl cis-trans isomerase [Bacteroidota bacterium]|nr:FKBP-type peptidyl-prolyl cis-trans isomerase [Bacteroidota bacterium]
MKQLLYVVFASMILFSCTQSTKKFTDGTEYKIISDGKGKKIVSGNFLEFEILKKYKDSVIYDSREIMPQFALYDTSQLPPLYKVLFKNIRVGDSIYSRNKVDSIYKMSPMPPYAKKDEYETTTYKFTNAYTTKEQTDSAYAKWLPLAKVRASKKIMEQVTKQLQTDAPQLKIDDKILSDYIAAHKLSATKAPFGTYVVITNPGVGENINDSSVAVVNYTGKTLDGKVFDSNTDSAFGHKEPIDIDISRMGGVIIGWTDGLKLMKKGSKGMFLIPSSLAYGTKGSGDKIKPNENLIFDIEIIDVITPAQYQAKQMEMQKKQMEMQQRMQQMQQQMQQRPQAPQK